MSVRTVRRRHAGLAALMADHGLTLLDLSQRAHVDYLNLSAVFNLRQRPKRATVQKLAKALGVSPDSLQFDVYDPEARS